MLPATEEEVDRIEKKDGRLILKSYGLPLIFWGYMIAILTVVLFLGLAIWAPLEKVLAGEDQINKIIAYLTLAIIILGPLGLICFFFYEFRLAKKENEIIIDKRIFGIPFYRKKLILSENDELKVEQFMDSPNLAAIKEDRELRGFANKGYFQLIAILGGKRVILDRHSRKADLVKIKCLTRTVLMKTKERSVSILIPTYCSNSDLLKKAIKSALEQTYEKTKIVIADDLGPFDACELSKEFTQERITFHKNSRNMGMFTNIDHAIRNYVETDDVFILCQDDHLIDHQYLSRVMEQFNQDKVSVALAGYRNVY